MERMGSEGEAASAEELVFSRGTPIPIQQPLHLIHHAVHLFDRQLQRFVGGHVYACVFDHWQYCGGSGYANPILLGTN